ncbi:hypothetical protein A2U01_0034078, partial [Trifolium medium]|nr:hypothetical protein [Trifolium medium]
MARAWAEFFHRNVAPVGNSSEYQIENALGVQMIMEEKDIDLGLCFQESIRKIAWNEANKFSLGHCNLVTALCRHKKVPENFDDGEVTPIRSMTWKYFNEFESGPVEEIDAEEHEEEAANVGNVNDQGLDDDMEEIDRFDSSALP